MLLYMAFLFLELNMPLHWRKKKVHVSSLYLEYKNKSQFQLFQVVGLDKNKEIRN